MNIVFIDKCMCVDVWMGILHNIPVYLFLPDDNFSLAASSLIYSPLRVWVYVF